MWARRRNKKYVKKVNKYVDDIDQLVDRDVATFFLLVILMNFQKRERERKTFIAVNCEYAWNVN